MKIEDLCGDCAAQHPTSEHLKTLVPEGPSDRRGSSVGRGHWLEVTSSHKCPKCGALWENLVESGAGGHGNFWTRMDPPRT